MSENTAESALAQDLNSFRIQGPNGLDIDIPDKVDLSVAPYFSLDESAAICKYYQHNGYVVIRNLIPIELCDRVRHAFEKEIKPYDGYLYRQPSSGAAEKHTFSKYGYLLNSILNLQNLNQKLFPVFRKTILEVITYAHLYDAAQTILGEPGVIVQSMYFEGNPATWAHQDTYYLDSTRIGEMMAAWVALEDIHPGAGRFFVYPGSQKIDMAKNGGNFDIAFNHLKYKQLVLNVIKKYNLECRAPALQKGDVLFWAAKTIHGSLETAQPQFSRNSITIHFIPESAGFLQFQSRQRKLHLKRVGAFQVDCSKDQNQFKYQMLLKVESLFPEAFSFLKKAMIKLFTR